MKYQHEYKHFLSKIIYFERIFRSSFCVVFIMFLVYHLHAEPLPQTIKTGINLGLKYSTSTFQQNFNWFQIQQASDTQN